MQFTVYLLLRKLLFMMRRDMTRIILLLWHSYVYLLVHQGNGANRNSPVCDYGDKASLSVTIKVLDDLQEKDTEIYYTLAAYDDAGNILTTTTPENLCRDYIGQDCTRAGIYTFEKRLRFDTPNGNQTKFYPVIQMAFSTKSDSGYNLGAINMQCLESDQNQPAFVSWSDESRRSIHHNFGVEYGMLIATCCLLIVISALIVKRSKDNPGFDRFPLYIRENSKDASLLDL